MLKHNLKIATLVALTSIFLASCDCDSDANYIEKPTLPNEADFTAPTAQPVQPDLLKLLNAKEPTLDELAQIDRTTLSNDDQIYHASLEWDLEIAAEKPKELAQIPITHFLNNVIEKITKYPSDSAGKASTAEYIEQVQNNFSAGIANDRVLPVHLVEKLIAQFNEAGNLARITDLKKGDAEDRSVAEKYEKLVAFLKDEYTTAAKDLDRGKYAKENGAAGKCEAGYCGMRDGAKIYAWLLKNNTTATKTADEIFNLGQSEVSRILQGMTTVCYTIKKCTNPDVEQQKSNGKLKRFFAYLNQPNKFYYQNLYQVWNKDVNPTTIASGKVTLDSLTAEQQQSYAQFQQALKDYSAIEEKINTVVAYFFDTKNTIPKLGFQIVPSTYAAAPYDGVASYKGGSPQNNIKGSFILNPFYNNAAKPEWQEISKWSATTLLVHEGIPGHHFQIAHSQERAMNDPNFPAYMANRYNTAYGEGWALYAESLAETDFGLYRGNGVYDPNAGNPALEGSDAFWNQLHLMGKYNEEMLRAMRLVVDTGIHAKGWSRDEAVQYMRDNSALGEGDIQAEVSRYMGYAGQATSYKFGQLSIEKLRAQAKAALGDKFSYKQFHYQVLHYGNLPMTALELNIHNWIKEKLAQKN